jgi:2'-5' RNA ligase
MLTVNEPKKLKRKFFIAVVPPQPIFHSIQLLKQHIQTEYGSCGSMLSPPHITLHMPFEVNDVKEKKLSQLLTAFASKQKSFSVSLKGKDGFEPRVVYINVDKTEALLNLQRNLCYEMAKVLNIFNQRDDKKGFTPHMTIAFRDLKKDDYYSIMNKAWLYDFTAEFNCNSIALLHKSDKIWEIHEVFNFGNETVT